MMTQRWRDADVPALGGRPRRASPRCCRPGVHPDVHDGATYVGLIPFRMVGAGVAARPVGPVARDVPRDQRPALLRRRARDAAASSSAASTRPASPSWPGRRPRSGCPTAGRGCAAPTAGRAPAVSYLRHRRPHPSRVAVRGGTDARPRRAADFLTARWGLHERHAGRRLVRPQRPRALAAARRRGAPTSTTTSSPPPGSPRSRAVLPTTSRYSPGGERALRVPAPARAVAAEPRGSA